MVCFMFWIWLPGLWYLSSLTRYRTYTPAVEGLSLTVLTPRDVPPDSVFFFNHFCFFLSSRACAGSFGAADLSSLWRAGLPSAGREQVPLLQWLLLWPSADLGLWVSGVARFSRAPEHRLCSRDMALVTLRPTPGTGIEFSVSALQCMLCRSPAAQPPRLCFS